MRIVVDEPPAPARRPDIYFEGGLITAIVRYAAQHAPREVCGVIWATMRNNYYDPIPLETDRVMNRWLPVPNIADHPARRYEMDPQVQLLVWQAVEDARSIPMVVWHSHPMDPPVPSPDDLRLVTQPHVHLIVGRVLQPLPQVLLWTPDRNREQGWRELSYAEV